MPPQIDRSQPAHRQPEPFLYPGVVAERDGGIVVRGAQAIATSAVLADWLFLSYITPLVPGDEDYARSFVVPMAAEGLRLYPRRPFGATATSVYDYPLSSRFDEVDATVVFHDVFVPWEHVFVYRNVDLVNAQFHESPSHTIANFQSAVRFSVMLELMAGLAMKLVELHSNEKNAAAQATLGGDIAAFQAVPSSEASFTSPETRVDTERYYRSGVANARERIKLIKLIWDFVGTEFAGRQFQYEMFYSAAQPVVNTRMFRAYDWPAAKAAVDRCLDEYAGRGHSRLRRAAADKAAAPSADRMTINAV